MLIDTETFSRVRFALLPSQSRAYTMKTTSWLLLFVLGVSGCSPTPSSEVVALPKTPPQTQLLSIAEQIEEGASRYSHFATNEIVRNFFFCPEWPVEAREQQVGLMADLQTWSKHPEVVRSLIQHTDAKVRTLALGALFVGEDFQDLPLIASLEDDQSPSFLSLQNPLRSYQFGEKPIADPISELEEPQTVGEVARKMLEWYTSAAFITERIRFLEYWTPRAQRRTCASWFQARMSRAKRKMTPFPLEYSQHAIRILDEIRATPTTERAWTLLYVIHIGGNQFTDQLGNCSMDAELLAAFKAVGPDSIIQFLKQRRVTDDPDLWFDDKQRTNVFSSMSRFVLQHATELLRPQDAPVLLECSEEPDISSLGWAAAAAELTRLNAPVGVGTH